MQRYVDAATRRRRRVVDVEVLRAQAYASVPACRIIYYKLVVVVLFFTTFTNTNTNI